MNWLFAKPAPEVVAAANLSSGASKERDAKDAELTAARAEFTRQHARILELEALFGTSSFGGRS